jgi:type VII secretion-associated protein (TIGR03931 family)
VTVVIEVGPEMISGPKPVAEHLIASALQSIDDDLAVVDEQAVAVQDLWRDVMRAMIGDADGATLVLPTWWSKARAGRVHTAALSVTPAISVLRRADVLSDGYATLLEVAEELVVISTASGRMTAVARTGGDADIAAVASAVGPVKQVLVDAPADMTLFAATVADHLRRDGVTVSLVREGAVRSAAVRAESSAPGSAGIAEAPVTRRRRTVAVVIGLGSAVVLCGAAVLRGGGSDTGAAVTPVSLLVEGRMGVMVPATWTVQRVTSGPGSARVQLLSSTDADVALHLTHTAGVPADQASTAEVIRIALRAEPDGAFVDFNPSDTRAGRPAVTYREIRERRQVAWAVVLDDTVRIAIGCQSAPDRELAVRDVCDRAIRSAHAIF